MNALNNLLDAWTCSLNGRLPDDFILWGQTIRWWARFGVLAQMSGVVIIVIDGIGPIKIREYSQKISKKVEYKDNFRHLRWIISFPVAAYRSWKNGTSISNPTSLDQQTTSLTIQLSTALMTITTAIMIFLPDATDAFLLPAIILLFVYGCLLFLLSFLSAGIGFTFDSVILTPLARILENPLFSKLVRILEITLLLFGIHFSWLAS